MLKFPNKIIFLNQLMAIKFLPSFQETNVEEVQKQISSFFLGNDGNL